MIEFAKLSVEERANYFQEVANQRGLNTLIVEKDFWVCFILRILFELPELSDKCVFKGGTSLSKVFKIIKRFSEDVDLSLDPEWLGFGGENAPDKAPSRSQFYKRCKKLEEKCVSTVENQLRPILESAIVETLRNGASGTGELHFNVDSQTRSPVLIFRYPTKENNKEGYIRPQVKLELGSLTDQRPVGTHAIIPWVAEVFPDEFESPNCEVVALEAERSFWEKVTILHAEFHRPSESAMRSRLSRDYYDVFCMAEHESGTRALADLSLLDRVAQYKQTYFHSAWASYETAKPGTLRLVPNESRLGELKTDYHAMQQMFFETPPSFDEILNSLANVEKNINHTGR